MPVHVREHSVVFAVVGAPWARRAAVRWEPHLPDVAAEVEQGLIAAVPHHHTLAQVELLQVAQA